MKKNILAVDDSPTIQMIVKSTLEGAGFSVEAAGDGEEALEKVAENPPDLIVLDVNMPKMDGFTFCQTLKYEPDYQQIPIIFLTTNAEDIDRLTGLGIGADEYLTKPFEPKKLIKIVNEVFKIRG